MSVQNSFLLKYTRKSSRSKQECPVCKKQFTLEAVLAKHLKSQHDLQLVQTSPVKNPTTQTPIQDSKKPRGRPRKSDTNQPSEIKPEKKKVNGESKLDDEGQDSGCDGDVKRSGRKKTPKILDNDEVEVSTTRKRGRPPKQQISCTPDSSQNTRKKLFSGQTRMSDNKAENEEDSGMDNGSATLLNTEKRSGKKRHVKSESDSQPDEEQRRPKRNRREKRAWSPSNDNSIVLDISIKQEPIDYEEYSTEVDEPVFCCDICNKSFSTKGGLSRHLVRLHQDKAESPVKLETQPLVKPSGQEDLLQIGQEQVVESSGQDKSQEVESLGQNDISQADESSVKVDTLPDVDVSKGVEVAVIDMISELSQEDQTKCSDVKLEKENVKKEEKKSLIKRRRSKGGKLYPCDSCPKVFNKPSHLLRHKVKHTGERPFPCDICNKGFVSKSNMEKHRVLHSGVKSKICDECGKAFALSSYLVRHKMLHEKERNEQLGIKPEPEHHLCAECGKVFSKALYLQKHIERHVKGKCYECRICGKKFSQRMNRINHEFLHSKTKNYECNLCHKKFALKCYLKIHLQRHEKKPMPKPERQQRESLGLKPFKCDECGKCYSSAKYLNAHEKLHQNPKKFVCETCGRNFHQKINLQRHVLTHTEPVSSKNYECTECGKKYSRDIYLDRHIKENHTPEGLAKPRHHCSYCPKTFTKPCLLRIHERTHTKEKPFVCSTCGKGFAQEGYMKIHEEIHSEHKKHECTYCGKSFALLYYLTRHLARHDQVKTISCDMCPKMFATQKALIEHQRIHTGNCPFKCELCGKSFPRANSLQRHKKLNACQNKTVTYIQYPKVTGSAENLEELMESREFSCLYICSICRQVFTSQAKLDAHAVEHEQVQVQEVATDGVLQEVQVTAEAIPVTKEEETIIAEVVNVEEDLLGGEEITTEETVVDADWLNRLFSNAHVESGSDGKIIIVVNRE